MIASNTGPLIALAKVDLLGLLPTLYGGVVIPPAVHHELLAKIGPEAQRLETALKSFLRVAVTPSVPPFVEIATAVVDSGEREAVAVAYQLGLPLLIDDRLGRQAAQRVGVSVTGTVGVLLLAKQNQHISVLRPVLYTLRESGYWLADELITMALKLAAED